MPDHLESFSFSRSFCDSSGLSYSQEVREVVSPGDSLLEIHLLQYLHSGAPGKQHLWQAPFSSGCALIGIHRHNPNSEETNSSPPLPLRPAFPKCRAQKSLSHQAKGAVFSLSFPSLPPNFLFSLPLFSIPTPSLQPCPRTGTETER